MMKRFLLTAVLLSTIGLYPTMAQAATWEEMGEASTGELVSLDVDSVRPKRNIGGFRYNFAYNIGQDTVTAYVNCSNREISPDRYKSFIPNPGTATDRMVDRVCEIGRKLSKSTPIKPQSTAALDLQPGMYRGSQLTDSIRIAKHGDRIYYATSGGRAIASVSPHPTKIGFYKIGGRDSVMLQQEKLDTLSFSYGSDTSPRRYLIDTTITPKIGPDLQTCLDSTAIYDKFLQPKRSEN